MWQCPKCRESVEDSFVVCWSCGTSKDGVEDPSFRKAEDVEGAPSAPGGPFRESMGSPAALAEHAMEARAAAARGAGEDDRRCPHCGAGNLIRGVPLGLTATAGDVGLQHRTLLVVVGTEPLLADLCKACGSVARLYVRETGRNWLTPPVA